MRPPPSAIMARTTYFVSTIGDSVLRRTSSLDLRVVHQRQRAVSAERRVVDEAVDRPEALAQPGDEGGMPSRSPRSNGANRMASGPGPRRPPRSPTRVARLSLRAIAMTWIAGGGELARDREAQAAAAAGDDDVTHHGHFAWRTSLPVADTSRPRTRSGSRPAPCRAQDAAGTSPRSRVRVGDAVGRRRRRPRPLSTTSATTIAPVIGLRARPHQRDPNVGVTVDRRLDLLGMHLVAADIDDAALAADEVIAPAAQFHDVAGIDETVAVEQRRRVAARHIQTPCAASAAAASRPRP